MLADNYGFNVNPDYAVKLMKLWKFGVSNAQCEMCLENSVDEYVAAGIIDASADFEHLKTVAGKPLTYPALMRSLHLNCSANRLPSRT